MFKQTRRDIITCSIEELTHTTCKWPIGNPQDKDFAFCGSGAHDDATPYCEFHAKMAYRHDYVSKSQEALNKKLKNAA